MPPDLKHINYVKSLTKVDILRIDFHKERGKVTKFSLQYEALIDNKYCRIMRIDNSHDNLPPHKHTFHSVKDETKKFIDKNPHLVYNEELKNISKNFRKIKENYLYSS